MARKRVTKIEELEKVYFLYGDEELLMEEALKRLTGLFSSQSDANFNYEVLNGKEVDAQKVIDCAETVPLASAKRLVVLRDADKLSRKDQEKLATYLDNQNPSTCLVMVTHFPASGEERDPNAIRKTESSILFEAASKHGDVVKFTFRGRGKGDKLDLWITEQVRRRGKKIEPRAKNALIEKVGSDLRELQDAIERLSLYCSSDVIRIEDVEVVVISVAEKGIFEFIDSVAERRRNQSLYLLNKLIMQGESPARILNLLLRQFRLIASVKMLSKEHESSEISRMVGIPPFLVAKCLQQARKFTPERLASVFQCFRDAQVELHSSAYLEDRLYESMILEKLVVRVIG